MTETNGVSREGVGTGLNRGGGGGGLGGGVNTWARHLNRPMWGPHASVRGKIKTFFCSNGLLLISTTKE